MKVKNTVMTDAKQRITDLSGSVYAKLRLLLSPEKLPGVFGAAFAFLMMLFHPLIYDDYFFTINRYKFSVMCYAVAAGFFAYVLLNINRIRKADQAISAGVYIADAGMLVFLLVTVIFCFTSSDVKTALMFASLAGFCIYMLFSTYYKKGAARQRAFRLTAADIGMLFFVLIAFVSCLMADNVEAAFFGTNGRKNGLLCILVMGAVYVIVSRSPGANRMAVWALVAAGAVCALIGIFNFFKIDPLGYYDAVKDRYVGFYDIRLKKDDHFRFISTIGNIDFFTAFLALFTPAVITLFVTAKSKWKILCLPAVVIASGAMIAARTEGAILCFAGSMFFAVYFGLKDKKSLVSCLAALSAVFMGFSIFGLLVQHNAVSYLPEDSEGVNYWFLGRLFHQNSGKHYSLEGGAMGAVADHPLPMAIAALLFAAAAIAVFLYLKIREEKKHVLIRKGVYLLLCAVIVAAAVAMFINYTFIDTETELTGAKQLLRFNDNWGTYRGGVWTRSLKLYGESNLRVKLIGFGPDELKKPLADAYGAEIAAYSGYTYDNVHNELIQYLLTLGALGLAAYLLFFAGSMYNLFRQMKNCPYAAAAFAAGATYFVHALVTVNQPITTPLFFLILSVGAGLAVKKEECAAPQILTQGEECETAETRKAGKDVTDKKGRKHR